MDKLKVKEKLTPLEDLKAGQWSEEQIARTRILGETTEQVGGI